MNIASQKLYMHLPTKKATQKDRLFILKAHLLTLPYQPQPNVHALVHKYIINSSSECSDLSLPFSKGGLEGM